MDASNFLEAHADVEKGTIIVSTKFPEDVVHVIAGSCPVIQGQKSFFISPEKDKPGIIAVSVSRRCFESGRKRRDFYWDEYGFILSVSVVQKNDNSGYVPRIELNRQWIPPADRLASVVDTFALQVKVSKEVFTTWDCLCEEHGLTFVSDSTLLCKFLLGQATIEEVHKSAEEHAKKVVADKAAKVAAEEATAQAELRKLAAEHSGLFTIFEKSQHEVVKLRQDKEVLWKTIDILCGAIRKKWFKGTDLRAALWRTEQRLEKISIG